jgi:hypothetical protein
MRRLEVPAAWTMQRPGNPKLLKPSLERTALHKQNNQQEHEFQEQGKVRHRSGCANNAIEAPNPTTTSAWVKREFSTVFMSSTRETRFRIRFALKHTELLAQERDLQIVFVRGKSDGCKHIKDERGEA